MQLLQSTHIPSRQPGFDVMMRQGGTGQDLMNPTGSLALWDRGPLSQPEARFLEMLIAAIHGTSRPAKAASGVRTVHLRHFLKERWLHSSLCSSMMMVI